MEMNTDELSVLADMLSSQRLARLEEQLAKEKEETDYWRHRCEVAEQRVADTDIKNIVLTNYIMLSLEKIKSFVKRLKKIEHWAFLRAFIQWSLPDDLSAQQLPLLEQMLPMPDSDPLVRIDRAGDVVAEGGTKVVNDYITKKGDRQ